MSFFLFIKIIWLHIILVLYQRRRYNYLTSKWKKKKFIFFLGLLEGECKPQTSKHRKNVAVYKIVSKLKKKKKHDFGIKFQLWLNLMYKRGSNNFVLALTCGVGSVDSIIAIIKTRDVIKKNSEFYYDKCVHIPIESNFNCRNE